MPEGRSEPSPITIRLTTPATAAGGQARFGCPAIRPHGVPGSWSPSRGGVAGDAIAHRSPASTRPINPAAYGRPRTRSRRRKHGSPTRSPHTMSRPGHRGGGRPRCLSRRARRSSRWRSPPSCCGRGRRRRTPPRSRRPRASRRDRASSAARSRKISSPPSSPGGIDSATPPVRSVTTRMPWRPSSVDSCRRIDSIASNATCVPPM